MTAPAFIRAGRKRGLGETPRALARTDRKGRWLPFMASRPLAVAALASFDLAAMDVKLMAKETRST